MLFQYLKGVAGSVTAASIVYVGLFYLVNGLDEELVLGEIYLTVLYGFLWGGVFGSIALAVIWMDDSKDVFAKRKIIIFTAAGILIGFGTEMLFYGPTFPYYYLFASIAGSLAFLSIQKIKNLYFSWSIIFIPIGFTVLASQMPL